MDYRVNWLKGRILAYMDVKGEELVEEMVGYNDGEFSTDIYSFLEDDVVYPSDVCKNILIVYKTFYDKVTEEEVPIREMVKAPTPPPATVTETHVVAEIPETDAATEEDALSPTSATVAKIKSKKGKAPVGDRKKKGKGKKTDEEPPTDVTKEDDLGREDSSRAQTPSDVGSRTGSSPVEDDTNSKMVDVEDSSNEEKDTEHEEVKLKDKMESIDGGKEEEEGSREGSAKKKKKEKKGSGRKKVVEMKKRGRISPATLVQSVPEPEPDREREVEKDGTTETDQKYIIVWKKVPKVTKTPRLHYHFGIITPDETMVENHVIYFIRTREKGIPFMETEEDALKYMPQYFCMGSVIKHDLNYIEQVLKKVFVPVIHNQFREPCRKQFLVAEKIIASDKEQKSQHNSSATFKRPSDYRQLSIIYRKELASEALMTLRKEDFYRRQEEKEKAKKKLLEVHDELEDIGIGIQGYMMSFDDHETSQSDEIQEPVIEPSDHSSSPLDKRHKFAFEVRYIDQFNVEEQKEEAEVTPVTTDAKKYPTKFELEGEISKFINAVEWTIQHVKGDTVLKVPSINKLHDPKIKSEELAKDVDFVIEMEEAVSGWKSYINEVIETYLAKKVEVTVPLAIYEYWHERDTALNSVMEHLKNPVTKLILDTLKISNSQTGFDECQNELMKHFIEAHDNMTFLSTVAHHFMVITESQAFYPITKILRSLMDGLHLIWILSRYFGCDEQMMPIMESIAYTLCNKVKNALDISKFFRCPLKELQEKVQDAIEMLRTWKRAYLETRQKIERHAKGKRWEFDSRKLFGESDYLISVCGDLLKVVKVLKDFHNIFGPELKSIMNDPAQIDNILKSLEDLFIPFEEADFDVYSEKYARQWQAIIDSFFQDVKVLDEEAKFHIDECFKLLRSSDEALKMLLKLQLVRTRKTIQRELSMKYNHILLQFKKEIDSVYERFDKLRRCPSLLRDHPNIAGAIICERLLFYQLKKPVLYFKTVKQLQNSKLKDQVFTLYLQTAKEMDAYEQVMFNLWSERSVAVVQTAMNQNILELVTPEELKRRSSSAHVTKGRPLESVIQDELGLSLKQICETGETQPSPLSSPGSSRKFSATVPSAHLRKESDESEPSKSLSSLTHRREAMTLGAIVLSMKWVAHARGAKLPVPESIHVASSGSSLSALDGKGEEEEGAETEGKDITATDDERDRSEGSDSTRTAEVITKPGESEWIRKRKKELTKEIKSHEKLLMAKSIAGIEELALPKPRKTEEDVLKKYEEMEESIMVEGTHCFALNFEMELQDIMAEVQLLENLGFSIPPELHHVALQHERITIDIQYLEDMIDYYNRLLQNLTLPEIHFMKCHLREVERYIRPGLFRINWNYMGIRKFAIECSQVLKGFESLIHEMSNVSMELQHRMDTIENFDLFYVPESMLESERQSLKDFFSEMEEHRTKDIDEIVHLYTDIGPMLMKLESLILETCTGCSPQMTMYYEFWEQTFFSTIVRMVASNMEKFYQLLCGEAGSLFQVETMLSAPDIVLCPSPKQVYNVLVSSCMDFLQRFKLLPRWMHETCIMCPVQKRKENEDCYVFSYFDDVIEIDFVNDLFRLIQDTAYRAVMDVVTYLHSWRKYQNLWVFDKEETCDKFCAKGPSLLSYDERLAYFTQVITDVKDLDTYADVSCMRVGLVPAINAVIHHATEWKSILGLRLQRTTQDNVVSFKALMEKLHHDLYQSISKVNSFRKVLEAISTILNMNVKAELHYQEIQECYRTLRLYGVDFPPEEEEQAKQLQAEWSALHLEAFSRAYSLEMTKMRFAIITQKEIDAFVALCNEFATRFQEKGPPSVGSDLELGLRLIYEYSPLFAEFEERRLDLIISESLFDLPMANYAAFMKAKDDFCGLQLIFNLYQKLRDARLIWSKMLWVDLDSQILLDGIGKLLNEFRKLPTYVINMSLGKVLELTMKHFKNSIPLMMELKHEALRERHWLDLMEKTGVHFNMSKDTFILGNIFSMELHRHRDLVMEILNHAVKELLIERGITEIVGTWDMLQFVMVKHSKANNEQRLILVSTDEILQVLNDNSLKLQFMAQSPYVRPFLQVVKKWENYLSMTREVLEVWTSVQRKWLNLEAIFVTTEVCSQLPDETKLFEEIDAAFCNIMRETAKKPVVRESCQMDGRLNELLRLDRGLEVCQKSLNAYLYSKRNAFPRFYFISDDELLSILGITDLEGMQDLMMKMFNNISKLRLVTNEAHATMASAMISHEGEVMEFRNGIPICDKVEIWMSNILKEMYGSNRYFTKKAILDYGISGQQRKEWMINLQGMICLAANQVWWAAEVEETFHKIKKGHKDAMMEYMEQLNIQLNDLVSLVHKDLSAKDRKKFSAVLLTDIHTRDVIHAFIRDSITDVQQFEWESQLRFYWVKDVDNLIVKQCTGVFEYGYEYLGVTERLVITPLTDRLYLTFTQALSMNLGGAVTGPAGTGKTETIKDLARVMGLLCIVMNCGNGMDHYSIGKVLIGLVQSGVWGCFDDFNRISLSVLSVISTQVRIIQRAAAAKMNQFLFEGQEITLDSRFGIFITMNPGYVGRTELPESMKSLFRPVVCLLPDLELICHMMLFVRGFTKAKILAKNMIMLYKLAQEQLSKQNHYDFGLRSLKSVLIMAGELKRKSSDLADDMVLMTVLRDINMPKLVHEDIPLFLGLLDDIFPGLNWPRIPQISYPNIMDAVKNVLTDQGYTIQPVQVNKMMQTYETMMTRHSTIIVGPTGGGKSLIIHTLANAQRALGYLTKLFILNPKAYSVKELYGFQNPVSQDWTDGLLSKIFREINRPTTKLEKQYIVFDGDIDPIWIENMNSVMDDNKVLTLTNGERIGLQPNCVFLFEVGDLQFASPATVSRTGVVYVHPKDLGYRSYWQRWLQTRPGKEEREQLGALFEMYIPGCIQYIHEGIHDSIKGPPLKLIIPMTPLNMVMQLCFMLEALMPLNEEDPDHQVVGVLLECKFMQAIYWSLGSPLIPEGRLPFDEFVKKISGATHVKDSNDKRATLKEIPSTYATLYDYQVDEVNGEWVAWDWLVPTYIHDPAIHFTEILVPTVDTVRTTWALNLVNKFFFKGRYFHKVKRPVVLVGETGTSKTAIVQDFLRQLPTDLHVVLNINFSSRTTSIDVQKILEVNMEKRTTDSISPPQGKKLVCFIDDLNMPQIDEFGTQQPIALLKLLFERGGFYDRERELNWKIMKDVGFFAAMGKAGGGRNEVDHRFISTFNIFGMVSPSDDTTYRIYHSILDGHTETFIEEIKVMVPTLVTMTLELHKVITKSLPPTPSKFHYIFNLRDLSRMHGGLCLTSPQCFRMADQFLRVWRNEFKRIFCDRLISAEEKELVDSAIFESINKYYPEFSEYALRDPLLFGDYRNAFSDSEPRMYEDLLDYDAAFYLFQEIMEEYNEKHGKLNLILFDDALEHLTRIHRVLRIHMGHMLIVGIDGCGKKSLTLLAAFTAGCDAFSITVNCGYNELCFKEDLKKLYYQMGCENKSTVFLFTDSHIVEEGVLEFINNMLIMGVIPTLFTDQEKETITKLLEEEAGETFQTSRDQMWKYFCLKCQKNLHMVLVMSFSRELLCRRCRSFPGLVNKTTIDWFFPWPRQALVTVANVFLAENPLIPDLLRAPVMDNVIHVHQSALKYADEFFYVLCRKIYISPKNYLDFIKTYLHLVDEKLAFISKQCESLSSGMTKITEAEEQLNEMNAALAIQQISLTQKIEHSEALQQEINEASALVREKKCVAEEKLHEVEEQQRIIIIEKNESESLLAQALPALEAARVALSTLDKNDITELRSFQTPPEPVQTVCECVAVLRGSREASWKSAKALMSDSNFLKSLQDMNCDFITGGQIRAVKTLMKRSSKLDQMKSISKAGYGLLQFVEAVLAYSTVFREVKPKREHVAALEAEFRRVKRKLNELNEEIVHTEELLSELQNKYDADIIERGSLQEGTDAMMKRLVVADKLISGLTSEYTRWTQELDCLKSEKERVIGNYLVTSAVLSYIGPFNWEFRHKMVYEDWLLDLKEREIPVIDPFKLESILSDDVELSKWNSEGLPSDELSIQNGILTTRAICFPLCIDPQEQAVNWIKKKEERANLQIMTFNDTDFVNKLELSMKYGYPVLLKHIEEYLDPVIDNILEKNIKRVNGKTFVMLGDKEVEYDDTFRIYLTSKLPNPHFSPAIYAKTTVINFTVTTLSLEDRLLNLVLHNEREDLEIQRVRLIMETSENKNLLKSLGDILLYELTATTGNLLDNVDLIQQLENTKSKATEVTLKLKLASQSAQELEMVCDGYRCVARRGAILYFVLSDMVKVNSMYQYSLPAYLDVFQYSLKDASPSEIHEQRIANLENTHTKKVYHYGCTGLFEKHKLLFSFQMALKLEQNEGHILQSQVNFFIKGNASPTENRQACPATWISSQGWNDILGLSEQFPETFGTLPMDITESLQEWKYWYDLDYTESANFPSNYSSKISKFEVLMLLRCFRIDRVYRAITNYISDVMGEMYVTPPVISIDAIVDWKSPRVPIIFILSPGCDPSSDVMELAARCDFGGAKFRHLSLGQGQEVTGLAMLRLAVVRGQWLMFQNCHLLIDFMHDVEKILSTMENPNPNFQLWLTTESIPTFPIGLLQHSIKVVTEPPNGLKHNLRRTYLKLQECVFESCSHPAFKTVIYGLAFFKAVVQERQRYGKIGWNIAYDFNETDFNVCVHIIDTYLTKANKSENLMIPWENLKYLIGEVIYGGRVTDEYDQRILNTYTNEYFGDFLFDSFDTFFFYHDDKVEYSLPSLQTKEAYLDEIDKLPSVTTPEVFGFHPNSDIMFYTQAMRNMWSNLIELQPRTMSSSAHLEFENIVDNVANKIIIKIPPLFDLKTIHDNYYVRMTPLIVELLQELELFNKLVKIMLKTLSLLRKALGGEVGMDDALESIAHSLYSSQIPKVWRKFMPATCKALGSWMDHFQRRTMQYTRWVSFGDLHVIWLSGLHIPRAYLHALVQMICRKKHWSLDHSTLYTCVSKFVAADDVKVDDNYGTYWLAEGLHLEGARWDIENGCLAESYPKVLIEKLPLLMLQPVEGENLYLEDHLHTPVYVTSQRKDDKGEGFVFEADLFTKMHPGHWILQGVCLLLNTD